MGVFIFLLSASLILITLIQTLTVNLIYKNDLYLEFDFLFIKFTLYPFKNATSPFEKAKISKSKRKSIGKRFIRAKKRLALLREVIKRCDIRVIDVSIPIQSDTPHSFVMHRQNLSSFIAALITTLKENARSFSSTDLDFFKDSDKIEGTTINISFSSTIIDILTSTFAYFISSKRNLKLLTKEEKYFDG